MLEIAYLFCYPLVPLGLLTLYIAGLRGKIDGFWFVVLVSTYICYAITPFVPAFPPRSLIGAQPDPYARAKDANKGRIFNRWILKHGSIHAISFPSAHVASAFAIALFFLRYALPIGVIFLVIAVLISLGAVVGRYHYSLDVLLGGATACAVFLASYRYL
jgi:membrane-associated phospholipid phosphatase